MQVERVESCASNGLPSPFDMRLSNPPDLHPAVTSFPQIRFVVPHFGAGMLREALMLADLCPNVWLDTSSSNHWMMYEGLDLRTVYRRAIDLVGQGRFRFGNRLQPVSRAAGMPRYSSSSRPKRCTNSAWMRSKPGISCPKTRRRSHLGPCSTRPCRRQWSRVKRPRQPQPPC